MNSKCDQCGKSVNTEAVKYYSDRCNTLVLCSRKCGRIYLKKVFNCNTLEEAESYMEVIDNPKIRDISEKMKLKGKIR